MKGSLQEQLLKSGLISEERLNQPKKKTKKQTKSASTKKKKMSSRDKQHAVSDNFPTPEELKKQKELRIEVKKLLRSHKLNDKTGEIAHNYTINNQVKRFFVTPDQQKQLADGKLTIANWNEISYLISVDVVNELRALYPKINIADASKENTSIDKDDPYADYAIPDDIKW